MTQLRPMRPESFPAFVEEAATSYAQDNVLAGRWPATGSAERARTELKALLPKGLSTANHVVYEIFEDDGESSIGHLWFAVTEAHGQRTGYIYNIRVRPEFRGRGHAKAALELVEQVAIAQGLTRLGLHVFAFNHGAQALYRSSGYGVVGMNMLKPLRTDQA